MPTLSERLMKVALLGVVPDDDQHVVADANAEIDRLRAERDQFERAAGKLRLAAYNFLCRSSEENAEALRDAIADEQSPEPTGDKR